MNAQPKKTALNAWHVEHGAKMTVFSGWELPIHYGAGIVEEHLTVRKVGGLFDISHMGRFRIAGPRAVAFLQHVLSNNVESLDPWQAQYTLIPDESGAVIDDAYLYRMEGDEHLLVVNACNRETDLEHLRRHAARFSGVSLDDVSSDLAMIAFQGPLSAMIIRETIHDGRLPDPLRNSMAEARMFGARAILARTGYTGEPIGFELFVPSEHAERVWAGLYEAGRAAGVRPIGLGARDTLRLEAGLPLHTNEYVHPNGSRVPALALPTAWNAISFSPRKGDFVGRRALAEQFEEVSLIRTGRHPPLKTIPYVVRPIALLERGVARRGDRVFMDDREIGMVTSGTVAPFYKFAGEGTSLSILDEHELRSLALGCVRADVPSLTDATIEIRGRRVRASIVQWHGRSDAPPYFHALPAEQSTPAPARVQAAAIEKAAASAINLLTRAIENHEWRQRLCINLIPSEMTASPLVRLLQVSDPSGRYAEHRDLLAAMGREVYYYQGTDFIAWVEEQLADELRRYLGCPLIEARIISGQMANMTVFSAFVDYKNRAYRRREAERIRLAFTNHIGRGGHLSSQPMGALGDFVARDPVTERYAVVYFPVTKDNPYRIDLDRSAELMAACDPELVILGKSMVLHPEPVCEIRSMAALKKNPPIIMYDMAHVLGLLGPHFQEPFKEGADIVTGSTHKTFFGTQRGVIGGAFDQKAAEYALWNAIRRRAFPGMLSNHHLGTLLGLLMAAIEMNTFKSEYQPQVISNAKAFARALKEHGVDVQGDPAVDFTETHQVIVRVGYARGSEIARRLEANNIIVNYQALPDDESFTASSGLRMGVAEMTRFGMNEQSFRELAELVARVILRGADAKSEIIKLRQRHMTMLYCFDGAQFSSLKKRLLDTLA